MAEPTTFDEFVVEPDTARRGEVLAVSGRFTAGGSAAGPGMVWVELDVGEGPDLHLREALRQEVRTTPLDAMRPAQDLLEDLLDAIRSCWLLYQEDAEDDDAFIDAVRARANANQHRPT